jgi:hypothetical protein
VVELFFSGAVFGFVPAGQRPLFTIYNLDRAAYSP